MKKYSFTAKIQEVGSGGAFVLFPYDVKKEFGTRGRVPVQATLDGVAYRGSLMQCGAAEHMLGVLKAIRAETGKDIGDSLQVVLWKDEAERTVEVPEDLAALMKKEKLLPFFEKLSYTHRKEYFRWITEAKKPETRARRLEKSVEMMRSGVKTPG
jgi:hypothetical protein